MPTDPRTNTVELLTAARAEALFTSSLSRFDRPTPGEVAAAIRQALRVYGGVRGCAGEVALAFGDHPESAVERMRWARSIVQSVYLGRRPGRRRRSAPRPSAGAPASGRH